MVRFRTLKACISAPRVHAVAGQSASGFLLLPPDADARVFLLSLPGAIGRQRGAKARVGGVTSGLHGDASGLRARTFAARRLCRHAVETGRATA
ncbi:hypothetical protein XM25_15355 [Devosia sp. H5989]|nr:hypothetical protein XM25_15355 [Devosia sp. H5989]